MKILVYPHSMEIGGSQLNAIELAAATRDRGHDVVVVSERGPLVETVHHLKLDHIPLDSGCRPLSPDFLSQLTKITIDQSVDIVHGYEWTTAMALYFGPHLRRRIPVVCTIMSMAVAPFLPRRMPLIVGTESLRRDSSASGHQSVTLLEPPVDVSANNPTFDAGDFRARYGISHSSVLIGVVSRLVDDLKLEGLLSACDAVGSLANNGTDVQLVIVGDGAARDRVAARAARANADLTRPAVIFTGQLDDPRPAYASADIMLGMGGSALRAMAFGKPLIVQGELGFWQTASPETAPDFLEAGWYGVGELTPPVTETGFAKSAALLRELLAPMIQDPGRRIALGSFGRALIADRFSLERAAAIQESVYERASGSGSYVDPKDVLTSAAAVLTHRLSRKVKRLIGATSADDFNVLQKLKRTAAQTRAGVPSG